jgi:hypothetical protein
MRKDSRIMSSIRIISSLAATVAVAFIAVPSHAAVTQLLNSSDLTGSMATLSYSGMTAGPLSTPLMLTGGGNTLTLTTSGSGDLFFQLGDGVTSDFNAGTPLLETVTGVAASPDGPLTISFADPVTEFGLSAQDFAADTETFSFTVDGTQSGMQTFTLPATDNVSATSGTSVFLGADAGTGNGFTSVTINSTSSEPGASNDFLVGPIAIAPAVPEASSSALLLVGMILTLTSVGIARRRRSSAL